MQKHKGFAVWRLWIVLVLVAMLLPVFGYGQTQQGQYEVVLEVSNEACRQVQIVQFIFLVGESPFASQFAIPPATISMRQARQFTFQMAQRPTAIRIRGTVDGQQTLDVTVGLGTTEYTCGTITMRIVGETPPEEGPVDGLPDLPSELRGIQPGMRPEQVVNQLRDRGFEVEIQGSEEQPKLGDVDDPLLIGALGPGLTVTGYWVSTSGGTLRAAVLHDRPLSSVFLIVVTNFLDLGIAWSPTGGGLGVFLDRPMAMAPGTNFGDAPLSGTAALVLVVKLGGPAQPYVLSLSN